MNIGQEPNRNAEEVHGIETLRSSACGQWMNRTDFAECALTAAERPSSRGGFESLEGCPPFLPARAILDDALV